MKAKYINPFLAASINLFKDYLEVDCRSGAPYINTEPQKISEVAGLIGLAGETVGAVVISFGRETAINIASKMSGTQYLALSNEVLDIVGELVNIVAGNAKQGLMDFRLVISLPSIIIGNESKIRWPSGIPVITIPFESEFGPFYLNVSLKGTD